MKRTEITFHSGLDTIGGVVMEVQYDHTRLFFEAGTAYNPAFDMFDGTVKVRQNFISDYLWLNEIPAIDGIYRRKDLKDHKNIKPYEDYHDYKQAFFITHMHLDHMRMMGMIAPEIPVYLRNNAQKLEAALEEVNMGVESIRGNNYTDIPEVITIGDITVRTFTINPNSYQDLSFYIETPDLKIHYTGDVFVYGIYRDNLLKEIDYVHKAKPDILVVEGTRFQPQFLPKGPITPSFEPKDGLITKDAMDANTLKIIQNYPGLILLSYYEREMSDVMDFEKFAQASGRTLVYEPQSAHLVNRFFNHKVTVLIPDAMNKEDILPEILEYNDLITKDQIIASPEKYIVQNSYPNLLEVLDYRGMKVLFLHHSGTPLGDYDPKLGRMKKLLAECGFDYIKTYFTEDGYFSPHAEYYQLLAYIDMIDPKLVIPCHTLHRKLYYDHISHPKFMANLKETYVYDPAANTMEVIKHE